jgi:DNA-binding protein HU-beta
MPESEEITKKDLVDLYATFLDTTKAGAEEELIRVFDFLRLVIANGNTFGVPSFGKFEVFEKSARNGRNPKTGEAIKIEAKSAVKFKPSGTLKALLNAEE